MASTFYNEAKRAFANADYDWVADDMRLILCMNTTDADTANDGIVNVDDLTIDECDSASGYARKVLGTKSVAKDDSNDLAKLIAATVTFTTLATCTRTVVGALIYKHVTTDADSLVVGFVEFAAPITPDGSDFTITWHANGMFYMS